MPASLADKGVGEQVLKSIRLFYDDEHSLGQVMNAAGLQPFFSELTVQEDGSALGFIFCKIGESFLELDLKIQPGQRTVVFTNALFLDSEMEKACRPARIRQPRCCNGCMGRRAWMIRPVWHAVYRELGRMKRVTACISLRTA